MSQFHKQEHFTASPPPVSGPKQHEEPPTGGEAVLQDQFTMFREQDPDNNLATFSFLDKLKQNYQSNPSLYDLNYGPSSMGVKVVTITWTEHLISNSINTILIKAMTIQDVQDQLLLFASAEKFTTPTSRNQLFKITTEKGIQAIMDNNIVDLIKNKVQVKYLYKPNLTILRENYFGATKRTHALHVPINLKSQQRWTSIKQQIDNGN